MESAYCAVRSGSLSKRDQASFLKGYCPFEISIEIGLTDVMEIG
jgi:hypothetical protein